MSGQTRRGFLRRSALAAGAAAWLSARPGAKGKGLAMAAVEDLLFAGVAVRDITPPPGAPLWGYTDVERIATGTRDPLYARAIVFRVGNKSAGIVTLDLGRMPTRERCDKIRARAREAGVGDLSLVASHTHSGPYMEMPGLPYLDAIDDAIVDAVKEAAKQLAPVRMGVGHCSIDIAHNRRVIKDGQCYMLWRNEKRLPTAPLDKEAGVIRIDGPGGKPLATLVNYACHPVIFSRDNLRYSADWAGAMCKGVEKATGAPCLFLQGACGDINPYLDKTPLNEGADKYVEQEGGAAARAVVACRKKIDAVAPKIPSLDYRAQRVALGMRWDMKNERQAKILREAYGPMFDAYMAPFAADPTVPLDVLVLNRDIAFTFFPGEPFIRFQLDLKRDSPVRHAFLCGYANEFHAYFPTAGAAVLGGYGASSVTYVEIGAGEKLVAEAKIAMGKSLDRVHPLSNAADLGFVDLEPRVQRPEEWGKYWWTYEYEVMDD